MKVGVWIPDHYLHSVKIYFDQVSQRLSEKGVEFIPFRSHQNLPKDVDLYWDPTCTGGKNPNIKFLKKNKPLVATVHGAANFALPHHYTYRGWKQQLKGYWINFRRKMLWNAFRKNIEGVITVSEFAREEINKELQIPFDLIHPIHHGYDASRFYPIENRSNAYLLHVSVYQPVKNIETLIEAYKKADPKKRLPLKLIVPGFPNKIELEGIELKDQSISPEEVAQLMQNAKAFFLPSIRESFGLPIIESMSTGTPVIVSKGSACEEIAKGFGILCHPLHVEEWTQAIENISTDDTLWQALHQKALERAKDFSWDKSAEAHFQLFKQLITSK